MFLAKHPFKLNNWESSSPNCKSTIEEPLKVESHAEAPDALGFHLHQLVLDSLLDLGVFQRLWSGRGEARMMKSQWSGCRTSWGRCRSVVQCEFRPKSCTGLGVLPHRNEDGWHGRHSTLFEACHQECLNRPLVLPPFSKIRRFGAAGNQW